MQPVLALDTFLSKYAKRNLLSVLYRRPLLTLDNASFFIFGKKGAFGPCITEEQVEATGNKLVHVIKDVYTPMVEKVLDRINKRNNKLCRRIESTPGLFLITTIYPQLIPFIYFYNFLFNEDPHQMEKNQTYYDQINAFNKLTAMKKGLSRKPKQNEILTRHYHNGDYKFCIETLNMIERNNGIYLPNDIKNLIAKFVCREAVKEPNYFKKVNKKDYMLVAEQNLVRCLQWSDGFYSGFPDWLFTSICHYPHYPCAPVTRIAFRDEKVGFFARLNPFDNPNPFKNYDYELVGQASCVAFDHSTFRLLSLSHDDLFKQKKQKFRVVCPENFANFKIETYSHRCIEDVNLYGPSFKYKKFEGRKNDIFSYKNTNYYNPFSDLRINKYVHLKKEVMWLKFPSNPKYCTGIHGKYNPQKTNRYQRKKDEAWSTKNPYLKGSTFENATWAYKKDVVINSEHEVTPKLQQTH